MKHVLLGSLIASPITTVMAFIGPYSHGWPLALSIVLPVAIPVLLFKFLEWRIRK